MFLIIAVSAKKSRKMPRMPPRPTHLMIRLALHGCVNRPFYHVVLLENRSNRDFFPKEQIGSYDPLPNIYNEKLIALNFERLRYWVACGAQCSKPVEKLLGSLDFFLCSFFFSYLTCTSQGISNHTFISQWASIIVIMIVSIQYSEKNIVFPHQA